MKLTFNSLRENPFCKAFYISFSFFAFCANLIAYLSNFGVGDSIHGRSFFLINITTYLAEELCGSLLITLTIADLLSYIYLYKTASSGNICLPSFQESNEQKTRRNKKILLPAVGLSFAVFLLLPGTANAQSQTRCVGQEAVFSDQDPQSGFNSRAWQVYNGSGWVDVQPNATGSTYQFTTEQKHNGNQYRLEYRFLGLYLIRSHSDVYTLTVVPIPTAPTTPVITRHADGTATLSTSGAPSGGSYRWYTDSSGGSPIPEQNEASYTTSAINSDTYFYVSAVSPEGCEGPRAEAFVTVVDTDGDGVADHNDLDDDNDGIPDTMEGSGDKDGDGIVNSLDLDSDGDGILDAIEANNGIVPSAAIFDLQAGRYTSPVGVNGLVDVLETHPDSGLMQYIPADTDGDGLKDFLDIDSDNDGIKDNQEAQPLVDRIRASGYDMDQDGIDDSFDGSCGCTTQGTVLVPVDTDMDLTPDYIDADSDDDGAPDEHEAHDVNNNAVSADDLLSLAQNLVSKETKALYPTADASTTWLKDSDENGVTDYLQFGSEYYHDANNNGLVDLFENNDRHESTINPSFRDGGTVTPLPVTLISFTARAQHNNVLLQWSTASEQDNEYFMVERSLDGRNFIAAGKVLGAGSSNVRLNYEQLDTKAPTGTLYYRLKQVDLNGNSVYSKVVAVQVKDAKHGGNAALYPNPATDIVKLDLTMLPAGSYAVHIFGTNGQLVQESFTDSEVVRVLEVRSLKSGHYIIRIQSDTLVQTLRLVKK